MNTSGASAVGKGLPAGLVGTAVMTVASTIELAPAAAERGAKEVAIDGLHHAVYASANGTAYDLIDRS